MATPTTPGERERFEAWADSAGKSLSRSDCWDAWQAALTTRTQDQEADPADIIAGALHTSRAHAYELMATALDNWLKEEEPSDE